MKSFKNIDGLDKDQRRFKYGVIGLENAKQDLVAWHKFAFAGRLHKPVLPFIEEDTSFTESVEINRDQALNLSVLLNFHKLEMTMEDLATTICSLSYNGDIRMRLKMENPDKVKNIVQGSYEGLCHLYGPESARL